MQNKYKISSFAIWILIWELLSRFMGSSFLLPGPYEVILSLIEIITDYEFYINLINSLMSILGGFVSAIIIGFFLALISYINNFIKEIVNYPIKLIMATPIAALVLTLAIWIDRKYLAFSTVIMATLPVIYLAIMAGFENQPRDLLEMASVFQVGRYKVFKFITITTIKSYAYPAIVSASGLAIKSGISGEIIAMVSDTLGEGIYYSKLYLNSAKLFAYIVIILVISIVIDYLVERIWDYDIN